MEILSYNSSPCCHVVDLKGKLVVKSLKNSQSKPSNFKKAKFCCAKVESRSGSLRFYKLVKFLGKNPNSYEGLGSFKRVDSKVVLSGSYDGYVIGGEDEASGISESGKPVTKVLIPGLPDESNGEYAAEISSCFWEWKPKYSVHYDKPGCENVSSPPVLFLPGFGVGSFHYEKQLKDLGHDYRVWAMDFLGQGMSLPSEDPAPLSKEGSGFERIGLPWGFGMKLSRGQVSLCTRSICGGIKFRTSLNRSLENQSIL